MEKPTKTIWKLSKPGKNGVKLWENWVKNGKNKQKLEKIEQNHRKIE